MKAIVFDNGGKTYDRYTIIMPDGEIYSASEQPFHPCGFGQNCGNIAHSYFSTTFGSSWYNHWSSKQVAKMMRNKTKEQIEIAKQDSTWLGKEVAIKTLPIDVQKYISQLA